MSKWQDNAVTDEHGHLTLTEEIFLKAMIDNTIARELYNR